MHAAGLLTLSFALFAPLCYTNPTSIYPIGKSVRAARDIDNSLPPACGPRPFRRADVLNGEEGKRARDGDSDVAIGGSGGNGGVAFGGNGGNGGDATNVNDGNCGDATSVNDVKDGNGGNATSVDGGKSIRNGNAGEGVAIAGAGGDTKVVGTASRARPVLDLDGSFDVDEYAVVVKNDHIVSVKELPVGSG